MPGRIVERVGVSARTTTGEPIFLGLGLATEVPGVAMIVVASRRSRPPVPGFRERP